jgi:hypothetical protein
MICLLLIESVSFDVIKVNASEKKVILESDSYKIEYEIASSWSDGFNANLTITNKGKEKIKDWSLQFESDIQITNMWNGTWKSQDKKYSIDNAGWNKSIDCNQSVTIGFSGTEMGELSNVSLVCDTSTSKEYVYSTKNYDVNYKIESSWEKESQIQVKIKNKTDKPIHNWGLKYILNDKIHDIYNANDISQENAHLLKNVEWNQDIPANGEVVFGYTQGYDEKINIPEEFELVSVESITNEADYAIDIVTNEQWEKEANISLVITNNSQNIIEDWKLNFNCNFNILDIWSAELVFQKDGTVELKNPDYAQNIKPGDNCIIGMHINDNKEALKIENVVLTQCKPESVKKTDKKIYDYNFGITTAIKDSDIQAKMFAKVVCDENDELIVSRKTNGKWEKIANLYDSGNLTDNNDEIEGDGVFSNIISIDSKNVGLVEYKISLNSEGEEIASVIKEIEIIDSVTQDEYVTYFNRVNTICNNVRNLIKNDKYEYDKTIDKVVNELSTAGLKVSNVEKISGSSAKFTFENGLNFYLQFSDKSNMKTMIRGGSDNVDEKMSKMSSVGVAMTKSRNILYWAPFDTEWGKDDETEVIKNIVKDSSFSEDLTIVNDEDANVNSLKKINKYGLIVIATHGIGGEWIVTGERATKETNYFKELSSGEISIYSDFDPSRNEYKLFYMVNDKWLKNNIQDKFPDSILINNSCESSKTNILWDTFKKLGVKTYYGNEGAVTNRYATDRCKYLLNELLFNKKTTQDAYDNTFDSYYGNGSRFVVRGQGNLSMTGSINNKEFEEGYQSWNSYGDFRVLNKLSQVRPTEGNMMGMISTGVGNTMNGGGIYQIISVPENAKSLYFDWNFLSAEFLEYIGSEFDDPFEIKINCITSLDDSTVFNRTVNSLADLYGASKTDEGKLIPVSEGFSLNEFSDIWMTGWNSECVDISKYSGKMIRLEFSVANAADTNYPTAVLLDNIHMDSEYYSTDDYVEADSDSELEKNDKGQSYVLYTNEFSNQADQAANRIFDQRAYVNDKQVITKEITSELDFINAWQSMHNGVGEEEIDEVNILIHGTYYALIIDDALNEDNTEYLDDKTPENLTVSEDRCTSTDLYATYIGDLASKNINTLKIYSCNTGLLDAINVSFNKEFDKLTKQEGEYHIEGNVAQSFLKNNNIRRVIAYDGSVSFTNDGLPRISYEEGHYMSYLDTLKEYRKIIPLRYEGVMADYGPMYILQNGLDSLFQFGIMPNGEVIYTDDQKAIYSYKKKIYRYGVILDYDYTEVEVDLNTNEQKEK